MKSESIYIDRSKKVPVLKLNRPNKRNALNLEMWEAFISHLEYASKDESINVLVISGEDSNFSAGADIGEMKQVFLDQEIPSKIASVTRLAQKKLYEFCKPTIAMIRGSCVGGGCGIALCCDFRFGDETIKMGITPGNIGLVYSLADTKRLVQAVGISCAKDILFTGRLLESDECKETGLIDRVFPQNKLEENVFDYVDKISKTSTYSQRSNKKILNLISNGIYDDNEETREMFLRAFEGGDFKKGLDSFLKGKKPDFS
ncbi:MAG: hypothetical protein CBC47_06755 [Alphaproteobacteria bacterium TMED87]|nr:enoyl-CoA hydratase [Rhodospirillaceae bacterium]OUV08789.1 MAG: hypothetical protein CBC47_06755 [Alphaproteobacteria bacterium TMED87]